MTVRSNFCYPRILARVKPASCLLFLLAIFSLQWITTLVHTNTNIPSQVSRNFNETSSSNTIAPPITDEMAHVLDNVGLSISERYYWHRRSQNINTTVMTLFPGLPRLCHNEEYMRNVLNRCVRGLTSMVFLLQSAMPPVGLKSTESADAFDMCLSHMKNMTQDSQCNILVAKQAFINHKKKHNCTRKFRRRVYMQTIAIGRAYEWARLYFPPHKYYIRARLDAPWCIPTNLPRVPFIAMNHYKELIDDKPTTYVPSDRFAMVPISLASIYFDAWKVWKKVDCNDFCRAGAGNTTANKIGETGGECALSARLNGYYDKFKWVSVGGTGDPIARTINTTHVYYAFHNGSRPFTYQRLIEDKVRLESICSLSERSAEKFLSAGKLK